MMHRPIDGRTLSTTPTADSRRKTACPMAFFLMVAAVVLQTERLLSNATYEDKRCTTSVEIQVYCLSINLIRLAIEL
jgi:hypothetical protein